MTKLTHTLLMVPLFALLSCNPTVVKQELSISKTDLILQVGESHMLLLNNTGTDTPIWFSSDALVATVSDIGVVTAANLGKTTITAAANGQVVTCNVEVQDSTIVTYGDYKLVWEEQFEGNALNMSNWNYEQGGAGWGNNELQYYTDKNDNVRVENGVLIIEAKKESYQTNNYTSARITTKNKAKFRYGKVEASISLPSGCGTWPAFWMMPNNSVYGTWPSSGEIDIMEHIGSDPTMISHALHTRNAYGAAGWHKRVYLENVENHFHTYSIEWEDNYGGKGKDAILFYVDGVLSDIKYQQQYNSTYQDWPFDQEFFIILNVAIGGNLGGSVDDSIFNSPIQMKVDWIRVYQREVQ